LPGISQNVLSQRLHELEQANVVRHRRLGPPLSANVYQLTERGQELEPVLLALARWGSRLPLNTAADLSTDALMLALRTTFDPAHAAGAEGRFALELSHDRLILEVTSGGCEVRRAEASDQPVRATLQCDPATLRSLVFGGVPMDQALRSGALSVTGDELAAARMLHAFPRPAVNRS
jgi:putative sterol carrier protein